MKQHGVANKAEPKVGENHCVPSPKVFEVNRVDGHNFVQNQEVHPKHQGEKGTHAKKQVRNMAPKLFQDKKYAPIK